MKCAASVAAVLVACAVAGCAAILGFEDHTLLGVGDGGAGDGGVESGTNADVARVADAAADVGTCTAACGCFRAEETLATGQSDPRSLLVDAQNLYWVSPGGGSVLELAKSGGAPVARMTGLDGPSSMAMDAVALYYGSDTRGNCIPGIYRQPKTPLDADAGIVAQCHDILSGVRGISIDATNVYWLSTNTRQAAFAPKDGSGAISVFDTRPGYSLVVLNAKSIFWTTSTDIFTMTKGGSFDGGSFASIGVTALAADDSFLYFGTPVTVGKIAADGSQTTPTTIADKQNGPLAIALDDTCLYWANAGDGTIWSASKASGAPEPLATGQGGPQSITVDASGVYWANGTGEIMRLPR
jgi:hypothetical protein